MSTRNTLTSTHHVVVEGPIGVGKTSLARRLGAYMDAQLVLEQPELNPFLSRLYRDQERFALPAQLSFLLQRIDKVRAMAEAEHPERRIVADFLIEKDPLFALLNLDEEQYALYRRLYDELAPRTPSPDLVVYLQASPETLIARVRKRGFDMERRIGDAYLTALAHGYMKFFHDYDAAPVMIVNSENINFVDNDADFQLLVKRIEAMRGHREYFNRGE
ncbi:MAG TPA: deoxynucleoside kinase [Accumulibacter sp.]|nr:deoxynucleoside kinase [Accumulibacter sp.]HQC81481.1 deoxynucleoside kinase [Accumulibacter sp.]